MNDTLKKQKAIILENIVFFNGTLYKDEVVKVIQRENGDYRVEDGMGKIWYVPKNKFKELV
jgi:hypothetical protein